MKKVLLLTPDVSADVDAELTLLGQLGMVHITPFQPAHNESIENLESRIAELRKALALLEGLEGKAGKSAKAYSGMERGEIALLEDVLKTGERRQKLEGELSSRRDALSWYRQWGRVSEAELEELRSSGVFLKLYLLEKKDLKSIASREDVQLLGQNDNKYMMALLGSSADDRLNFEEIVLPGHAFEGLEVGIQKIEDELADAEKQLEDYAASRTLLEEALDERLRRFTIRSIQYGGHVIDDTVRCWKGYMPEEDVETFVRAAEVRRWGYVLSDPSEEDAEEVPTQVRSPRWAERIKPVMNFMGLVPGYKEIDVSRIFMLFFTFFAGILVGDAGYGVIFLVITLAVHAKMKFRKRVEIELFYTLSASIMLWGVLTGTYFGSPDIANLAFLDRLRVQKIASFGGDNLAVQKVMFFIGALHLSIGHLQLAWKYSNSVRAIAQIGWVAIAWGLYLIVNQMVLAVPAPGIMVWLFIGGALLIALFSNPGKNFFQGVLSSLAGLPLSVISGFSDIISYIRLYAVGLSTVLMATSFNQMAIGDGLSTVVSVIGAVIVLILGHGLNMILAAMAVIVHGVRLNMLEYAGHANVEFSGTEYSPFKLKKPDTKTEE